MESGSRIEKEIGEKLLEEDIRREIEMIFSDLERDGVNRAEYRDITAETRRELKNTMEYVAKVALKVNISLKDIMIILKDILVQIRKPSEALLILKNLQIILETALTMNIPPEQIKDTVMHTLNQKPGLEYSKAVDIIRDLISKEIVSYIEKQYVQHNILNNSSYLEIQEALANELVYEARKLLDGLGYIEEEDMDHISREFIRDYCFKITFVLYNLNDILTQLMSTTYNLRIWTDINILKTISSRILDILCELEPKSRYLCKNPYFSPISDVTMLMFEDIEINAQQKDYQQFIREVTKFIGKELLSCHEFLKIVQNKLQTMQKGSKYVGSISQEIQNLNMSYEQALKIHQRLSKYVYSIKDSETLAKGESSSEFFMTLARTKLDVKNELDREEFREALVNFLNFIQKLNLQNSLYTINCEPCKLKMTDQELLEHLDYVLQHYPDAPTLIPRWAKYHSNIGNIGVEGIIGKSTGLGTIITGAGAIGIGAATCVLPLANTAAVPVVGAGVATCIGVGVGCVYIGDRLIKWYHTPSKSVLDLSKVLIPIVARVMKSDKIIEDISGFLAKVLNKNIKDMRQLVLKAMTIDLILNITVNIASRIPAPYICTKINTSLDVMDIGTELLSKISTLDKNLDETTIKNPIVNNVIGLIILNSIDNKYSDNSI